MKKLHIAAKQWTKPGQFVKVFPFAKLPLLILWIDSQVQVSQDGVMTGFGAPFNPPDATLAMKGTVIAQTPIYLGYDKWKYQNKINAYRDIIRFAIGPDYPLSINFAPKTLTPLDALGAYMLATEYLAVKGNIKNMTGHTNRKYATALANRDAVINKLFSVAFANFNIETPSEWRDFEEVYGKFRDVDQVPANTIGYTVSNMPPPKLAEADWTNIELWSKTFASNMGMAYLNAVAENFPVQVKVRVENWRETKTSSVVVTKDAYFIKWIFQDFIITIGTKGNILVDYHRIKGTAEFEMEKYDAWAKWLEVIAYVGVAVIVTILTLGAAGAIVAGGAGAGASTGAATGVTVGAEAGIQVGAGMSVGASTVAGGAATGAVVASESLAVSSISAGGLPSAGSSMVSGGVATGSVVAEGGGVVGSATGISTGTLVSGATTVIGGAAKLMGGGGGSGGGSGGDPSLLDNVVSIAKPLANVYMQQKAAKTAQQQAEDAANQAKYGSSALKTINGVNNYNPITGATQAGMFPADIGGIPTSMLILSGVGILLTILYSSRR